MICLDRRYEPPPEAEIIDFDAALLDRCAPELRAELMTEASMLARAFAPDGEPDQLREMARLLSCGDRDGEFGRARARQLAAALKHLADEPTGALLSRRR